jgi:hypothetical protein
VVTSVCQLHQYFCYWSIRSRTFTLLAERGHQILVVTSDSRDLGSRDRDAREYVEFHGGLEVRRKLRWIRPGNLLEVAARTIANRRKTVEITTGWQLDLVSAFGVHGIDVATYEALTCLGIADVTLVGDTWLAQAWMHLPRFDPWIALASGRGRSGLARLGKRVRASWVVLKGGISEQIPRRQGTVQCISQFLLDDLETAQVALPPTSCVIPCHLTSDFFKPFGGSDWQE